MTVEVADNRVTFRYGTPTRPTVRIDSIGPDPVTEGETVEFTGSAFPEKTIAMYRWRSNLVASDLSEQSSFATDALPPGAHEITFSAQDQDGDWSNEAEATLTVKERPIATIESISPSPATVGETITFVGSATPVDDIAEFRWRTSEGDDLSDQATFSSASLPVGTHTILFSARNALGVWSEDASRTLQVNPFLGETMFVDNDAPATEAFGLWNASSGPESFRSKSLFSSEEGSSYLFKPSVEQSGRYDVALRWTAFENRRTDVPITIEHDDGIANLDVNQQQNTGEWVSVGVYRFSSQVKVTIRSRGLGLTTCVDGLRLTPMGI